MLQKIKWSVFQSNGKELEKKQIPAGNKDFYDD